MAARHNRVTRIKAALRPAVRTGSLMSPVGPGCVKTFAREEGAESFSLLPSLEPGRERFLFFKLTMSRRNFYSQIQLRSFHTAWAKSDRMLCSDAESFDDLVGNQTGADSTPSWLSSRKSLSRLRPSSDKPDTRCKCSRAIKLCFEPRQK
jgi:hypothetical protein